MYVRSSEYVCFAFNLRHSNLFFYVLFGSLCLLGVRYCGIYNSIMYLLVPLEFVF